MLPRNIDDAEWSRDDRCCNVLLPAFWLAVAIVGVLAAVWWGIR